MGISSEETRNIQFSGTEHAYEGREVEEFRSRVVAALEEYEATASEASSEAGTLASAQRIRQQAVQMAERMLREVMGASGDNISGLQTWQDAAMLRALAEEEMEFAREEARRLPLIAKAERDTMRAKYTQERAEVRAELQRELQSSRAAATAEATDIRNEAAAEAEAVLKAALSKVDARRQDAEDKAHRMERRLGVLQTALADAEARFRRLAATAANEVGTLAALADQDVGSPPPAPSAVPTPDLHLAAVDLTDDAMTTHAEDADQHGQEEVAEGLPGRDPEVGFYQRRLAGLRDRLEKSGHPPE